MSTRVFLNGRVYEYGREGPPLSGEDFAQPFGRVRLEDPNYMDGPWQLRYRLIDRTLDSDEWLTMPEATRLLSVKEPWIIQRVTTGQIDAVMVRGSSIPLFRFKDKGAVVREAILDRPVEKSSIRPKRERWDKE